METAKAALEDFTEILDGLEGNIISWNNIAQPPFDERTIERCVHHIGDIREEISFIHSFFQFQDRHLSRDTRQELCNLLELMLVELGGRKETLELLLSNIENGTVDNRKPGRPSIIIDEQQVHGLKSLNLPWNTISEMLGISERTLRRKRQSFVVNCPSYTTINDQELDILLRDLVLEHPNAGERMIFGHLISKGFRIARWRIRRSLQRVDPDRSQRMNKRRIRRRVYSVPGPNSLWYTFNFVL